MGLRSFLSSLFFSQPQAARAEKPRPAKSSPPIHARYDAAQTTDEFQNYWANADAFDADSAHSPGVRHALIHRSRYEAANNGYADGIAQTYATDLVGSGPTLRMQTGSEGFNRMVELQWYLWTKAIGWRRKLWCLAHAKHVDGEGIAVIRRNKRVNHPIKLDVVLYEAEQCQTPYLSFGEKGYIDGIKFDEFGNPLWYDILHEHPGATNLWTIDLDAERVPADRVLHWFKMRRPGQHRGVPECSSTLQVGASSRRMREATVAAVENAARLGAIVLESTLPPDEEEVPEPMTSTNTKVGMMTTMPTGWHASQMEAKHPNATYQEFLRSQIAELGRPKSMPANKSRCDSSDYNFASGRLDHISYYDYLDVDRKDCDESVCDPLFDLWFDFAIQIFGWLGGNHEVVGSAARMHVWDWPTHKVADEKSEALATREKLASGQILLPQYYAQRGLDFADEVERAAPLLGLTPQELTTRMLDAAMPVKAAEPSGALEEAIDEEEREEQERQEQRRAAASVNPHNRVNGHLNGVAH
jgi:capsid protein